MFIEEVPELRLTGALCEHDWLAAAAACLQRRTQGPESLDYVSVGYAERAAARLGWHRRDTRPEKRVAHEHTPDENNDMAK